MVAKMIIIKVQHIAEAMIKDVYIAFLAQTPMVVALVLMLVTVPIIM